MVKDIVSVKMTRNLFRRGTVIMCMAMIGGSRGKCCMPGLLNLCDGRVAMCVPNTPTQC